MGWGPRSHHGCVPPASGPSCAPWGKIGESPGAPMLGGRPGAAGQARGSPEGQSRPLWGQPWGLWTRPRQPGWGREGKRVALVPHSPRGHPGSAHVPMGAKEDRGSGVRPRRGRVATRQNRGDLC